MGGDLERIAEAIDAEMARRSRRRLTGVEVARFALNALREPSPAMEAALYASCDEQGHVLWRYGYRAMIDAVLAPSSTGEA